MTTVVIDCTLDTYIIENSETPYGTQDNINFGGAADGRDIQAFLKFDLSVIPAGVTLTSATLEYYAWSADSGVGSTIGQTTAFTESTVWSTRPTTNNAFVSGTPTAGAGTKTFDVLAVVERMITESSNYMMLKPSSSLISKYVYFYSREYNSGSQVPTLTITYPGTEPPMKINIGDSWKQIESMKINIGNSWKEVVGAKINIGDSWKTVF